MYINPSTNQTFTIHIHPSCAPPNAPPQNSPTWHSGGLSGGVTDCGTDPAPSGQLALSSSKVPMNEDASTHTVYTYCRYSTYMHLYCILCIYSMYVHIRMYSKQLLHGVSVYPVLCDVAVLFHEVCLFLCLCMTMWCYALTLCVQPWPFQQHCGVPD